MAVKLKNLSDEALVKQCQQELPYVTLAFEELVNRYKNKVYGKALSMLRHPQDAEDVAQEIFLKIFNNIGKFQQNSSLNTWITAITINTCLTVIEKRKRRPWWWLTVDIDDLTASEQADIAIFETVAMAIERKEQNELIELTLSQLPEQFQEVIELRFMEELDYQTIATRLNIKLSAAKMRIKRAREAFINIYTKLKKECGS
jgi:RNA polymerase sigma-70 factor (ECF subfamily)